jgi:hypothetical protein
LANDRQTVPNRLGVIAPTNVLRYLLKRRADERHGTSQVIRCSRDVALDHGAPRLGESLPGFAGDVGDPLGYTGNLLAELRAEHWPVSRWGCGQVFLRGGPGAGERTRLLFRFTATVLCFEILNHEPDIVFRLLRGFHALHYAVQLCAMLL